MVIQIGDELMIIKSVDNAANTVDVYARGAGGTTAAAHSSGDVYKVNGIAGRDVDLKNIEAISEQTNVYENYTQLFLEALDYTYMAKVLARQGLSEERIEAVLLNEALVRVAEGLGRTAIVGRKQSGSPRMTAGLIHQLSDTTGGRVVLTANGGGNPFDEDMLKGALDTVFNKGIADTIVLNPSNKAKASNFNLAATNVNVRADIANTQAGSFIETYVYEGQTLTFLVDQDMPADKISVVNLADCEKGWLSDDALRVTDEPAASSREIRKAIQGSIGFAINNVGYNHVLIENIG